MVITKTLKIKWISNCKKYYEDRGYKFTKCGDEFEVKFEDMPKSSDRFIVCKCDYCGKSFKKQIKKYYCGRNYTQKDACVECYHLKIAETKINKYGTAGVLMTEERKKKIDEKLKPIQDEIWGKIKQICKEKDYELVSDKYIDNETKFEYICNKHKDKGSQYINWIHLQSGRGCYYCGRESMAEKQKYTYDEVKNMVEKNGINKLVSQEYIGYADYNLEIKCKCGKNFITSLAWFLKGKTGCNYCNKSLGEKIIYNYLENKNIYFIHEHNIKSKKWKNYLRLDFYIPDYNIAIEFDGQQHYFPVDFSGKGIEFAEKSFQLQKIRDKIKDDYCKANNIDLLRIPYLQINNIDNLLDDYLTTKVIAVNSSTKISI